MENLKIKNDFERIRISESTLTEIKEELLSDAEKWAEDVTNEYSRDQLELDEEEDLEITFRDGWVDFRIGSIEESTPWVECSQWFE